MSNNLQEHNLAPLWEKTLKDYREELSSDKDFDAIIQSGSLEQLLNDKRMLQPVEPQGRKILDSMNELKSMTRTVDAFWTVASALLGADEIMTSIIWGSIRMILTLAAPVKTNFQDVIDMLEELGVAFPPFPSGRPLPTNHNLKISLLTIYTETILFYAHVIHFFRIQKHTLLIVKSWSGLRGDFERTIQKIKPFSTAAENELRLLRMSLDHQNDEKLSPKVSSHVEGSAVEEDHYLPYTEHPRFWGREDILSRIDSALLSKNKRKTLKSFALHGMGGVGKTQIAIKYANDSQSKYDNVFWISADNPATIKQSFNEIAKILGFTQPGEKIDDNTTVLRVKNWLRITKNHWLLVFDNVNDIDATKQVWPKCSAGSILVTSRDFNSAASLASDDCQVKPFDTVTGSLALLNFIGLDKNSSPNRTAAETITAAFGGLPLALSQVSEFIIQHKVPLNTFLPLYERNAMKLDSRRSTIFDNSYTLATVWEKSLKELSGASRTLHTIFAFLNPDNIHEALFTEGLSHNDDPRFQFVKDELKFLDAEGVLLKAALIDKSSETGIITMHKLIQRAVIRRLSQEERREYLLVAIEIVNSSFPNTYNSDVGHQASSWTHCEKSLLHVKNFIMQNEKFNIIPEHNQPFAELLLRCSWYLYEKENYQSAYNLIQKALQMFSDQSSHAYASALDLQGLIELDIGHPKTALNAFTEAYDLRKTVLPKDDPFLAASLVNLGLACTELGELNKAQDFLQTSIEIRLRSKSDRIGNSYSNMASLLLRMGKVNEAEAMLKRCPSLKNFRDRTFLRTKNPRFSGDMVLLSRIRLKQGLYDDALRLSSGALAFRRKYLGDHLKVCDSLYQIANIQQDRGNTALAIESLNECIKISRDLPELEGQRHLARASFKIFKILEGSSQDKEESAKYREQAILLKDEILERDECDEDGNEMVDFERLVPWMLW